MSEAQGSGPKSDGDPKTDDADDIPANDTHKTEKLTKAGRDDLDPDEGSE